MSKIAQFHGWLGTRGGERTSLLLWVVLLGLAGHTIWSEWRARPLGKPATLLYVEAKQDGEDLLVSFALHKTRDCGFRSSRWIENLDSGHRWYLPEADSSSVDPRDDAVKHVRFALPPKLPPGRYAFRSKGMYDCPDGDYPSDPSFAEFTVAASGRATGQ